MLECEDLVMEKGHDPHSKDALDDNDLLESIERTMTQIAQHLGSTKLDPRAEDNRV